MFLAVFVLLVVLVVAILFAQVLLLVLLLVSVGYHLLLLPVLCFFYEVHMCVRFCVLPVSPLSLSFACLIFSFVGLSIILNGRSRQKNYLGDLILKKVASLLGSFPVNCSFSPIRLAISS